MKLYNITLANAIGVDEKSVRRWLSGECLPSEIRVSKIIEVLREYEKQAESTVVGVKKIEASSSTIAESIHSRREANAKRTIRVKDTDNKVRNNANTTKPKKSKKSSTVNRDNLCSACPALSMKDERFVDGEGAY